MNDRELNREILEKAIEQAEKNGFENNLITCFDVCDIPPRLYVRFLICESFAKAFFGEEKIEKKIDYIYVKDENTLGYKQKINEEEFLNNHSYSDLYLLKNSNKVILNKVEFYPIFIDFIKNPGWQYHLQQMVLCKEPLKYLEKFL